LGSPDNLKQVKTLFDAALELEKEDRVGFLEKYAADREILDRVTRLLAKFDESGSTLSCFEFEDPNVEQNLSERQFVSDEVLARRFRIVRFLAAGGMGEVYEAEDLELRERVAVKCIRHCALSQPNALARFRREVYLARKVTHPNVCRIFDLFRHTPREDNPEQEIAFVSMELLRGDTLSLRIRQKGQLTPEEALPLITQIADGLAAAHRVGIVHRDFKPGNVILVPDDKSGIDRLVITDFGLALRTGRESAHSTALSASHAIIGTPAYMAPEQIEGRQATSATDIYALGLVISEMVTGARPSERDTPLAAAAKRLSDSPYSLKQIVPPLSPVWEQTIIRCLQRDPNARFSSALDVSKALSGQKQNSADDPQPRVFPRFPRLARIALVLALLFVITGAVYQFRGWFGKGHPTSVHAARRPTVAVLGFKNLSGKTDVAWISPALSQMLGTELTSGEQLRIIPSEQVAHGKIDLALADEESLGRDTLTRVRNNLGTDFVVLGTFLDMGGQIRIDLSLQNAVNGETIANISESGPEKNLPDLATRAGERLRHKLGVADPSADDAARSKASQSSSLKATKLYSEGLLKLHSFDALNARDLLERAIVEDPNYALAHAALAEAWRSLEYGDKSAAEAKKAMDLSGSLSRENRLAIEAQYRNSIHEITREAEIYKTLFNFYPDSFEYGFSLAKSQYFGAQYQEANSTLDRLQQLPSPEGDDPRIDHVRSAVARASGDYKKALTLAERVELRAQQKEARRLAAQALGNQCELQALLGDPAKASAACDKSRTIYSDIGDYKGEADIWGDIASQARDPKKGRIANERQIALLKKVESNGGLAWAMTVAGLLSADLGDYPRALREFDEALKLYQKIGYQRGIISAYGNLGWVNSLQGNLKDAEKYDEAAIALRRQTNTKEMLDTGLDDLAEVLLDKGDIQGAAKQLEEGFRINSETGDKRAAIYLHTARSRLLLAEGELDESRREAELAIKLCLEIKDEGGANERGLLLARLDIAQNHSQNAAEALRKTLSDSKAKQEDASQIEAKALLIEALLTMPSDESKREVAHVAKVAPNTQNASLRLAANLQIARARSALGNKAGALELLEQVISESKKLGYEALWLEARLARCEIDLQFGHPSTERAQLEQIAEQAQVKGLILIANKARSLAKG
jgi:serine/threonine protein kinase/tetratricopeptide (TPR) repeat protein